MPLKLGTPLLWLGIWALLVVSAGAGEQPGAPVRWTYKTLTKQQVLDLGNKDLEAGLNKVGAEGWELVGLDGAYIFKKLLAPAPVIPSVSARDVADLRNRISIAEYNVTAQRERVAWAERMLRKGLLPENLVKVEREGLRRLEMNLELLRVEDRRPLPAPKVTDLADDKKTK